MLFLILYVYVCERERWGGGGEPQVSSSQMTPVSLETGFVIALELTNYKSLASQQALDFL